MPNYKEIARFKAAGQSNRAVAEALGLARNTVNAAVARIEDSGLRFEDLSKLTDAQIDGLPFTNGVGIKSGTIFGSIFPDFGGSTLAISVAQFTPTQLALSDRRIQGMNSIKDFVYAAAIKAEYLCHVLSLYESQ